MPGHIGTEQTLHIEAAIRINGELNHEKQRKIAFLAFHP